MFAFCRAMINAFDHDAAVGAEDSAVCIAWAKSLASLGTPWPSALHPGPQAPLGNPYPGRLRRFFAARRPSGDSHKPSATCRWKAVAPNIRGTATPATRYRAEPANAAGL